MVCFEKAAVHQRPLLAFVVHVRPHFGPQDVVKTSSLSAYRPSSDLFFFVSFDRVLAPVRIMAYHHHLPEVEDRNGLIVMICLFSVLAVTSVVSRFLSRRLSSISFLADDWLSLASLIFVLGLNCIFLAATIQGAMTGHSPVVDYWPVPTPLEHLVQKVSRNQEQTFWSH